MKRTAYVAWPAKNLSAAVLTSLILMVGVLDVHAAEPVDTIPAIQYMGVENSVMVFNIKFNNADKRKVVVELTDQSGTVLYQKKYSDKNINKNIYLRSAGEKCTVSFKIKNGVDVLEQKFNIEPQLQVLKETVVKKL